jgi:hypothetical protein
MGVKQIVADARKAAREVLRAMRDPALFCWAIYLLAVPFYVIGSGLPQPGDWMIVFLLPFTRVKRSVPVPPRTRVVKRLLTAFILYIIATNLIWSIVLGNWVLTPRYGFLMAPLFYLYNALMFVSVLRLYRQSRSRFLWFTSKLVLVSLLMQVFISAIHHAPGLRVTVLFNNANQLGFFALLSASLLFLFQRGKYVSTTEVSIGMMSAMYLGLLSASKAALGGIAILTMFAFVVRLRTVLVVGVVMVLALAVDSPINDAIERTITRLETDQSNPTIEERGYDRIYNNPQYLVTGSGEGDYERFRESTVIGGHEIHSSIGTLLFCYGIVGLSIFVAFVAFALRGTGFRTYLLVAPSFAYGMAHQGLRFTLFWVLMGVVVSMRAERLEAVQRARAARAAARTAPAVSGVTTV